VLWQVQAVVATVSVAVAVLFVTVLAEAVLSGLGIS
jgi:hypothetical protein